MNERRRPHRRGRGPRPFGPPASADSQPDESAESNPYRDGSELQTADALESPRPEGPRGREPASPPDRPHTPDHDTDRPNGRDADNGGDRSEFRDSEVSSGGPSAGAPPPPTRLPRRPPPASLLPTVQAIDRATPFRARPPQHPDRRLRVIPSGRADRTTPGAKDNRRGTTTGGVSMAPTDATVAAIAVAGEVTASTRNNNNNIMVHPSPSLPTARRPAGSMRPAMADTCDAPRPVIWPKPETPTCPPISCGSMRCGAATR